VELMQYIEWCYREQINLREAVYKEPCPPPEDLLKLAYKQWPEYVAALPPLSESLRTECQKTDTNSDGKIDRDEWIARYGSDKGFDAYDLDGDGVIDADEFQASHDAELEFVAASDGKFTSGGSKITREQWAAQYGNTKGFDAYDLDGDGVVDADEFRACKAAEIDFGRIDTNQDGKVDRDEWIAKYGSDEGFDAYDVNGDGVIDGDEFRTNKGREIDLTVRVNQKLHREAQYHTTGEIAAAKDAEELDHIVNSAPGFAGAAAAPEWAGVSEGDTFAAMTPEERAETLAALTPEDRAEALAHMAPDERAKCVAEGSVNLSREEWTERYGSDEGFDQYDVDHDGGVNPEEFRKRTIEIEIDELDANHDGKIDLDEWIARYGSADGFEDYDADGDGVVDAEEFRNKQNANAKNLDDQFSDDEAEADSDADPEEDEDGEDWDWLDAHLERMDEIQKTRPLSPQEQAQYNDYATRYRTSMEASFAKRGKLPDDRMNKLKKFQEMEKTQIQYSEGSSELLIFEIVLHTGVKKWIKCSATLTLAGFLRTMKDLEGHTDALGTLYGMQYTLQQGEHTVVGCEKEMMFGIDKVGPGTNLTQLGFNLGAFIRTQAIISSSPSKSFPRFINRIASQRVNQVPVDPEELIAVDKLVTAFGIDFFDLPGDDSFKNTTGFDFARPKDKTDNWRGQRQEASRPVVWDECAGQNAQYPTMHSSGSSIRMNSS